MNTKTTALFLIASCALSACSISRGGFAGVPALKAGDTILWHYSCEDKTGFDAEYAQMGGSYSVTLPLPEGAGKRTLIRTGGGYDFALDELNWQSTDGVYFSLTSAGQPVYQNCQALNEAESDAIRNVRKIDPELL